MNSILITGCNRGLGLGLVKALVNLPKPPQHIFATCRNKAQAKELQALAEQHSNIHIIEIDLSDFNAYEALVNQVEAITHEQGLNVLFNNAGVNPSNVNYDNLTADILMDTLRTNAVVPLMLAKAFRPLLQKAAKANESLDLGLQRAAIINMSSVLGSIQLNDGGMVAYRTSKAALNSITKSLSVDWKDSNILCVTLHPGWVKTDMGGPSAPLEPVATTKQIVDTIMKFNASHHGGFYQYDGKQLPW